MHLVTTAAAISIITMLQVTGYMALAIDDSSAAQHDNKPLVKVESGTEIAKDGTTWISSEVKIHPHHDDNTSSPGQPGPAGPQGPEGPQGPPGPPGPAGANYIRWGRTTCNNSAETQTLYTGFMAGPLWSAQGGGSNLLCLPDEPEFLPLFTAGQQQHRSRVRATEYEIFNSPFFGHLHDENVPCAACFTTERGQKIMIPARVTCPPSWTMEYHGYIMSGDTTTNQHHRLTYECVDVDAEAVPGRGFNGDGVLNLIYPVEVTCDGIDCPPYSDGRELSCVVCTK